MEESASSLGVVAPAPEQLERNPASVSGSKMVEKNLEKTPEKTDEKTSGKMTSKNGQHSVVIAEFPPLEIEEIR